MSAVVPLYHVGKVLFRPKELQLIKRTCARDANDDEFNAFIAYSYKLGLDPLKRQVYCFVFSKDDPQKRQMVLVTSIGGFRTVAARSGHYRPDDEAPKFSKSAKKRDEQINPLGLVSAKVKIWVQDNKGDWYPVIGTARWDEYVPLKTLWEEDRRSGKYSPVGKRLEHDSNWRRMPYRMLEKVAEAHALRKAFPDDFSNVYEESEVDRHKAKELDLSPSDYVSQADAEERLARLGGPSVQIDWLDDGKEGPLDNVPVGRLADRAMDWIDKHRAKPYLVARWKERNRHALNAFWGHHPGDALAVRKKIEEVVRPPQPS